MTPHLTNAEMLRRSRIRALLYFMAAFILGGVVLPYLHIHVNWREPSSSAEPGGALGVVPGTPQKLSETEVYARAAQIASHAVVNIDMRKRVRVQPGFFDDWTQPKYSIAGSEGSGVIIDKNGDILTNEHVVGSVGEANRNISVTLMDGRKFEGTVIGSDHTTDVALVHINGTNLPVAQMGTVRGLVPGQMVVAIGNPFGFRFTVTHGVVSALDRPVSVEEEGRVYERLIQTDCAINPGNSGGALVNLEGQVIGINTIVLNGAQGIGFAIPIDTALSVADELKKFGRIKRPWLGMIVLSNNAALAANNDIPNIPGVVVYRLFRNGPALAAGLQPGDILTRIDGKEAYTDDDFKNIEKKLRIGQTVALKVQRGDQVLNGSITVGEAP